MSYYFISNDQLKILVSDLIEQNYNVICESKTGKKFEQISTADQLNPGQNSKPAKLSIKEFFFPKTESLFFFRKDIGNIDLIDPISTHGENVFIGVKPCDAAAIPVLQKVFNWDYKDDFFNNRLEHSVIIGKECGYKDQNCFCTSVGLSPRSEKGSDLFLYEEKDGYVLSTITSKGEEFLNKFNYLKQSVVSESTSMNKNEPMKKFEYNSIKNWLDNNFTNEFWDKPGELCLGCGQCTFVCPTCHCFDIVDEDCGYSCGRRVKNWDACQFGLFTKHASGHNPRENQKKRYRQRVSHKFKYYQDRFGEILCTGCGRCIRGCPVSIDISEILTEINSLQEKAAV